MNLSFRLLPLAAASLLLASSALAQVQVRPAASSVQVSPPTGQRSLTADIKGLRDIGQAALDKSLTEGWALAGFEMKFLNGDHKLRRIGVLPQERFVNFSLADQNGDDTFAASARITPLSGVNVQQVTVIGGGKFDIKLPQKSAPKDATLVLSGFEFRRRDGSDANLRNIGVWLDSKTKRIRVSLTDDQGLDFRGLEASLVALGAATVVPLPGLIESSTAAFTTQVGAKAPRVIKDSYGGYRGYQVTVQYAWVPNSMIANQGAMSGTHLQRIGRANSRIDALQGFEFTFNNSDHHLLGLGVNATGRNDILFQDNNQDDPMQWTATYLTLK